MPIVFEDPPSVEGAGARFRGRSPERQEMDELLEQLVQYPDQWARLYDFHEEDKEGAEKHAGKVRSAASYMKTGRAWSVAVRRTPQGWSVFAKMSSNPPRKRAAGKSKGAEKRAQAEPQGNANGDQAQEQAREPTFQ
jgi:hypothetical protein